MKTAETTKSKKKCHIAQGRASANAEGVSSKLTADHTLKKTDSASSKIMNLFPTSSPTMVKRYHASKR